jgi:general L-amino acid transport system ATP-binding protein
MSDSIIQIQNVNKWFGDFQVLKEINLEVKPKEKFVDLQDLENQL